MRRKEFRLIIVGLISFLIVMAAGIGVISIAKKSSKKPMDLESRSKEMRDEALGKICDTLKPLHKKRGPIRKNDWLASHRENGQTFAEYMRQKPNRPTKTRNKIYIQLIGEFTKEQMKVLEGSIKYMEASFGLETKVLKAIPMDKIPASSQRIHWGNKQLYTGYIMDKILLKNRPEDAVAFVGFTGMDLYPDPDWNFVYGIASLQRRIGLWSIHRLGEPDKGEKAFLACLRRTIATAIHETGHILTIHHCIGYECVMAGVNNQAEGDRRDIFYCPSCLRKLTWNTGTDLVKRYRTLVKLCKELKLKKEQEFFEKSLATLKAKGLAK